MGMDYERMQEAILRERVEEGRAEGRAEGIAEGRAEGILEANRENARKMVQLGIDVALISQTTGLTAEEIETLG